MVHLRCCQTLCLRKHEAPHNCATSIGIFVTFALAFTSSCPLSPGLLQPQIQALPLDITEGCFDSHDLVLDEVMQTFFLHLLGLNLEVSCLVLPTCGL